MQAFSPAPVSTVTAKPRAFSFLTVSGVAATRASPARRSFRTARFMGGGTDSAVGAEDCEKYEQDDGSDHLPLHETQKPVLGFQVLGHVGGARIRLVSGLRGHLVRPRS